ncbi:MAG: hypothetical protein P1U83_00885 [Roseovarius sp.]|nr:hypothetical protein [Roseovarius sp.]
MTRTASTELAELTNILFQAEQSKMRQVVEQEAALRRDLAQLDASREANLALPTAKLRAVRQIGADVQWQAWLGRTRADLNRRLALCLVQKERMMKALQQAHGRKLAADQINTAAQKAGACHLDKIARESEESLSVLKRIQAAQAQN